MKCSVLVNLDALSTINESTMCPTLVISLGLSKLLSAACKGGVNGGSGIPGLYQSKQQTMSTSHPHPASYSHGVRALRCFIKKMLGIEGVCL